MGRLILNALKQAGVGSSIEHDPTIGGLALLVGRKETDEVHSDVTSE